jgi:hypothetical protein
MRASYGPHTRASNPARIRIRRDREAGESPKILFDDAGDGSRQGTADQAAAFSARNCLYWVRLSRATADGQISCLDDLRLKKRSSIH